MNAHTLKNLPWLAIAAMAIVIVSSNFLVEKPINDWLVWGALTYPVAFLVTDVVNRTKGAATARLVVYIGFAIGVVLSLLLATPRIAMASGIAFLVAQLLDVSIFAHLRRRAWWIAPGVSSAVSTVVDTGLFFALAFVGTGAAWWQWAAGDLGVKWCVALLALVPYRMLTARLAQ